MSTYLALRDRRLQGGVPARPNLRTVNADATTPLVTLFGQINAVASVAGAIHSMFIFGHGYAGQNVRAATCLDAGGMGLQLGREDVRHGNVNL